MTVELPTALAVPLAAILGLVFGSFLNVVIWRVPRGESIVRPPSACPVCGAWVRPWDDVPVVSWLVLRGRCRDCDASISRRYPAVEALTGVVFVLVAVRFSTQFWALPAYLYLAAIGIALAFLDLDTHRLPDSIVLPAVLIAPALLAIASAGSGDWVALARALAGGGVLWAAYFVMLIAYPGGMGLGDVKLAAVLGMYLAWIGWGALFVGGFAAFVLGGGFSAVLLLTGRAGRKSGIPFGPWMILGAAIGIGWGQQGWDAYLGLMS